MAHFVDWPSTMLINGAAVEGRGPVVTVVDPATEHVLAEVPSATETQLDDAVAAARQAFAGTWQRCSPDERSAYMHALADVMERRRQDLIDTAVADTGTPISLSTYLQIGLPIQHLRFYADAAARDRTEILPPWPNGPRAESRINQLPVGVALALPAYNYPIFLTISKVGAALAAGCTVVVMPSPQTPLSVLLLGELIMEAGLPAGVVNIVIGEAETGRYLSLHPGIDKVAFTGSVGVGRQVMSQAAQGIKGVTLELGGKSANILLPDVDLAAAVDGVHRGYTSSAGQVCGALSRVLVPEDKYDEFARLSKESFARGFGPLDPWDPAAHMGPLISDEHRRRVEGKVAAAIDDGAELIAGGGRPDTERGYFTNPVLLGSVESQAAIAQEEVFGPVAVVLPYRDVDHAIELANDTSFGLNAAVTGGDADECLHVASQLRCGMVSINGGGDLRPDAVFGGLKNSGIGREYGEAGISEYLEPQHVIRRL